ncbi:hypothetical protein M1L60_30375 [Actinoplanes sp. TRM 88003]|uniref:Uncharacterized protein n=1 Tax=Paractinoplanes aksuensis TaxID=2939490 RepID=A0ABT1DVM4_9ACTN|nr:hypothetical protein [Actinoplanes aksuensis]MCO8274908.1 hypothetical protein [Actinoplanes aksuensis]
MTVSSKARYVGVAAILLAATAGAAVLRDSGAPAAADLDSQIVTLMRDTLEKSDPGQHNHAGHAAQPSASASPSPVICGVRVYGHEPSEATTLSGVRAVYGFHLCGVAESKRPWDVAVKLAGPLILDVTTTPPGIQVVEATADIKFVDRLRQMFPTPYAEMAAKEALSTTEMTELRRRYDAAADLP